MHGIDEEEECHNSFIVVTILCCCCVGFVLLIILGGIALFSVAAETELYYLNIGDTLGNSSALIEANSPAVVTVSFSPNANMSEYTIFRSDNMPSKINQILPTEISSVFSGQSGPYDLNYLGSNEPIYLLSGSSIQYNIKITLSKRINSSYSACLYLFMDKANFNSFLSSNLTIPKEQHCFASAVTRGPIQVSHSFNIASAGQYYAGIKLQNGVTVQVNVSVVRIYYDTTGLQQVHCSLFSCSINICNTFLCSHKGTTYFIIKPSGNTEILYYFINAQIHGSLYGGFIATAVIGSFCCCCCCCCFLFVSCCCNDYCSIRPNRNRIRQLPVNRQSRLQSLSQNSLETAIDLPQHPLITHPIENKEITSDIKSLAQFDSEESLLSNSNNQHTKTCEALPPEDPLLPEFHELIHFTADDQSSTNSAQINNEFITASRTTSTSLISFDTNEDLLCQYYEDVEGETIHTTALSLPPTLDIYPQSASIQPLINSKATSEEANARIASNQMLTKELLDDMKDMFGDLKKLLVDSSGLVYHNSEYGVTLIIPEGAIQQSATVQFGACLYSDKFKFGDYVPVTPIVWVHINQKLHKCAELYIPHNAVISSKNDLQQFTVLTADDDGEMNFHRHHSQIKAQSNSLQVFKIECLHFCSNCVAAHKRQYKTIAKQYLIARAEKKNKNNDVIVEFIFLCQQQGCKKMVEGQCAKEDLMIKSYKAVTFTGNGRVSLSLEPDTLHGWKRQYDNLDSEYISAESIDYYEMMGCDNPGRVTEEELERLGLLEDTLSYPPRFRIQFTRDDFFGHYSSQEVIVKFNHVHPPLTSTILLEGHNISFPLSPLSSTSSTISDIESHSLKNDSILGDCLRIVATEGNLKDKWFDLGFSLDLELSKLYEIEILCTGPIQCTRNVILHWRNKNESNSWEVLAATLAKINEPALARKLKNHFTQQPEPGSEASITTKSEKLFHCPICDKDHQIDYQQEVPSSIISSQASILDLINLVAPKVQDKFYVFGVEVDLEESYLKSLYTDYHTCMDRIIRVIVNWSEKHHDTFTWSTVVKVLQSEVVGASDVAELVISHLASLSTNTL